MLFTQLSTVVGVIRIIPRMHTGSAHADRISAYAISVYEMSFHLGTYLGRTATKGMTKSEVNKSFPQSALRRPLATLFILLVFR